MVLKSSKYGVCSGNTLRASNSLYNRQYYTHSSIVRHYVGGGTEKKKLQIQQLIENFDIPDFDVEFSLNKRERWVLPEVIRIYIQSGESPEDSTKTDLILRHKLKRQDNCVAYYSDKGHIKRLVPKVGRYFDGKTATNYKTRQTKGKRGNKTVIDIDETLQPDSDESTVRYEIFYPCSSRSSIVHNPKYTKPEGRDSASATVNGGKKNKRRSRLTSRDVNEMLGDRSEDFDFLSADDSDTGDVISRGNFTLRDFIKPERKTKRKTRTRRPSHEDDDSERKRSRIVFVDKDVSSARSVTAGDETYSQGGNSPSVSLKDPTIVIPVAVKVDSNEAAFDNLQTVYGRRYMEAKCEPRKFSIDMTDKLRGHVRTSTFFWDVTSSSLDLHGYLSFTEVKGRDDATLSVYNVALNIASHMNSIKMDTVVDRETYTLAQLEDSCLCYIDTLPRDVFVKRDAFKGLETPFMSFHLVNEGRRWNMNCIHPHEFSDNVCSLQGTYREAAEFDCPPDVCGICYDDIKVSTESTDTPSPATSLDACGHWFCDSCWRQHLVSKLRSGPCALTCPEYGCSVEADFPTLLSFLHIGDVKKHIERQTSEKINCSAQAKWCPKPQCGRAILAEGLPIRNRSIPVVCSCGTDLCFACMKNAHWPATCAQAKQFREKVIALKDYVTLAKDTFFELFPNSITVRGKSCPKCRWFIEKISGCPYMTCPCGAQFCWTCGILTSSIHTCFAEELRDVLIEENTTDCPWAKRTRFYTTALDHRQQRLNVNIQKYLSRERTLTKRIAAEIGFNTNLRTQMCDHSQEIDDQPFFRLAFNFMRRMLSIKLELHHVIENVAIAMDNMSPERLRNKLMQTLTRMESCAATIEDAFDTGPSLSNSELVGNLVICQKEARVCIARVAQLMKLLQRSSC
ncbi:uncharacterized protein LOC124145899 [Haliotis rufescens]|uniref:uncharacterized protein LOC124145899 n=1 Tax=Haliotis rufescens TaxID=6454 RepID=UPI00201F8813|nr:uncharacterized protein LOC124145899 [Haliotis rufescens]